MEFLNFLALFAARFIFASSKLIVVIVSFQVSR